MNSPIIRGDRIPASLTQWPTEPSEIWGFWNDRRAATCAAFSRWYLRPVFIWADEAAENFLSRGDSAFKAVARASGGCTVYLAQNINQYRKRLGDNDAFESFISNLQTKFFHQVTGPTAKWAAELLGERWEHIAGWTSGSTTPAALEAQGSTSGSASLSEQRRYYVEPARFTTLKRGGVAYGCEVTAICYKGGHIFSDGNPYIELSFDQTK